MQKNGRLYHLIDEYLALASVNSDKEDIVYGPYVSPTNGRQFVRVYRDGLLKTISYPKFILEKHLGRILDPDKETVDHLNGDFMDNRIENLRIVPREEHSADDTRRVKLVTLQCDMCGKEFDRSPRVIRFKAKEGSRGYFCSRRCAGQYGRHLTLNKVKRLNKQKGIKSEYFKRKNVSNPK